MIGVQRVMGSSEQSMDNIHMLVPSVKVMLMGKGLNKLLQQNFREFSVWRIKLKAR